MIDMTLYINYDLPVFSDPSLTLEIPGPHVIKNSTRLPKDVYFSNIEYTGQAENSKGEDMFTVKFTVPGHVVNNTISVDTGALYNEV